MARRGTYSDVALNRGSHLLPEVELICGRNAFIDNEGVKCGSCLAVYWTFRDGKDYRWNIILVKERIGDGHLFFFQTI